MKLGEAELVLGDSFRWMAAREEASVHSIVSDPPFAVREFREKKWTEGTGGAWRSAEKVGGKARRPAPRFSDLTAKEKEVVREWFAEFATLAMKVTVPGAHVILACTPLLKHLVSSPIIGAGFEPRGEVIRLVMTRRGGDRPKGSEAEFRDVTVLPRSCYEPWLVFRKPLEGKVAENLRRWGTGALRRESDARPFCDVIRSSRASEAERSISGHPSLKPQRFMRQVVRASLPLGRGVVLDPFMGSGSTLAAASSLGYHSVGVEIDEESYEDAVRAVPKLAALRAA